MPTKQSKHKAYKIKVRKQPFCITKYNSTLFAYKNHAYQVYKPKQKSLSKALINTIISDYEIMLSHYSRVFVVRIELHPKSYSEDNQAIMHFLKRLTTVLSSEYQSKVLYHCAREQETSDREHYHLEIMLSAHKVKHSERLLSITEAMWKMHSGGTVAKVDNPYCIVYRGDKTSIKPALYRSSYLAKQHTKELNGKTKGFLHNKLKPSDTFDPATDLMLVDPNITYTKKQRKHAFEAVKTKESCSSSKMHNSSKYGWFNLLSHAQQLKECISSRTTSLNHLINTAPIKHFRIGRVQHTLRHDPSNKVITHRAPYEPKSDHHFIDHSSSTP